MRTNVPSWCDRILWKSYPETHIVCNSYGECNHRLISCYFFFYLNWLSAGCNRQTSAYIFPLQVVSDPFFFSFFFFFFLGCTDDIVTSDHSPVFATFEVGVTSQFVSKKGRNNEPNSPPDVLKCCRDFVTSRLDDWTFSCEWARLRQPVPVPLSERGPRNLLTFHIPSFSAGLPKCSEQAYIEFESIEAIVKTASRTKFFIEFYSTCLEGEKFPSNLPNTRREDVADMRC